MNENNIGVNLAKAIVKFHALIPKVSKDSTNPHFKSKYASLSNILESVDPLLHTCGLAVVQIPRGDNELLTMLVHESGESIGDSVVMKLTKNDPQGVGSAITYYRRYALGAILSLNIDDDDDGNAASTPPANKNWKPETPPKEPAKPKQDSPKVSECREYIAKLQATSSQVTAFKDLMAARDVNWMDIALEAKAAGVTTWANLLEYAG